MGGRQFSEDTFGFLKRFESALCLFSNTVSQLYSNYEIVHFGCEGKKLVALPNAYASHDTFNNVDYNAVEATGLYIVPDEITSLHCKDQGLNLIYRSQKTGKLQSMPLADGLDKLRAKYLPSEPFLPVMINRDLKTLKSNVPAMHLHRLCVDRLLTTSDLEKCDISKTVLGKMESFYK